MVDGAWAKAFKPRLHSMREAPSTRVFRIPSRHALAGAVIISWQWTSKSAGRLGERRQRAGSSERDQRNCERKTFSFS